MRLRFLVISSLLIASIGVGLGLAILSLPSPANISKKLGFNQKVRSYLIANPELFAEMANILRKRSSQNRVALRKSTLTALKRVVRSPRGLPVMGNPKGEITVVEFFDYRCPYCKQSLEVLKRLVVDDPNLRLVFKELPVLGPESVYASRIAIASREQGKYLQMHEALMAHRGKFDQKSLVNIAREIGLDTNRLLADMQKPQVQAMINEARLIADRLAINGTPAMIIGDEVVPGYADLVTLKSLVLDARRKCTTC